MLRAAAARTLYLLSYGSTAKACFHVLLSSLFSACHDRFNGILCSARLPRASCTYVYLLSYGSTAKVCLHLHLGSLLLDCRKRFNNNYFVFRAAAARAAAARFLYLLSYGFIAKACLQLHLVSVLAARPNRANSILCSARLPRAPAVAARILYLLSYGSTAKACLLLLLGSLFSACQFVLCRLPFADNLRILSLLLSNSIAKACFYLLPGFLVPILASSGFDGRFAIPQEGPETRLKPVWNQSETSQKAGASHIPKPSPPYRIFFFSLHFRSLFFFLWKTRSISIYIYI